MEGFFIVIMRQGFNFYVSYYEVAKELSEKDRLKFLWAILEREFEGIEPSLEGMAKFAYLSQKHSIDKQVKGYEDKTGEKLTPTQGCSVGGTEGGSVGPSVQEKEKEKEKEKVQVEYYRTINHLKITFDEFKSLNIDYHKNQIDDVLDQIENYKNNKNYVSLYLTAKNWLKRDNHKQQVVKVSNDPLVEEMKRQRQMYGLE
jgi:hypothetical protein